MRKLDLEVQRVVDFRRARSLSDGGRIGFRAGVSQAFSKSPSQQTTHSRRSAARNVCVSREFQFTKGAYTKWKSVCQRDDTATPALVRKAGVQSNTMCATNYRRWLSSIESADVYPKRYGFLLGIAYIGRFTA